MARKAVKSVTKEVSGASKYYVDEMKVLLKKLENNEELEELDTIILNSVKSTKNVETNTEVIEAIKNLLQDYESVKDSKDFTKKVSHSAKVIKEIYGAYAKEEKNPMTYEDFEKNYKEAFGI